MQRHGSLAIVSPCCSSSRQITHSPASLARTSSGVQQRGRTGQAHTYTRKYMRAHTHTHTDTQTGREKKRKNLDKSISLKKSPRYFIRQTDIYTLSVSDRCVNESRWMVAASRRHTEGSQETPPPGNIQEVWTFCFSLYVALAMGTVTSQSDLSL